ncbi:MAG: hypothetical protein WC631_02530 [Candidatus Paceibacterota bacterium]
MPKQYGPTTNRLMKLLGLGKEPVCEEVADSPEDHPHLGVVAGGAFPMPKNPVLEESGSE